MQPGITNELWTMDRLYDEVMAWSRIQGCPDTAPITGVAIVAGGTSGPRGHLGTCVPTAATG
jgi:hypothetical protein